MQNRISHGLAHWANHFLWPSVVLASLIHAGFKLLEHFEAEAALDMPALVLAHRTSVDLVPNPALPRDARSTIAVAVVDGDMFNTQFKRKTPLDRCALTTLLTGIFQNKHIETVALDVFAQPNDAAVDRCQADLDSLLHSHPEKAIAAYSEYLPAWPNGTRPNIQYASPDFYKTFGVVLKHEVILNNLPSLGGAVASRVCASTVPTAVAKPAYCVKAAGTTGFFDVDEKSPYSPIAFEQLKTLYNAGNPIRLDHKCLQDSMVDCGIRHVIVGTSYSADDQHITTIGKLNGVQVHAAIAAQPRIGRDHLPGFLIDIACGAVLFGPLAYFFWNRFFVSKLDGSQQRDSSAYLWLVALCVVYTGVVVLLTYASVYWYSLRGHWISPVPMALGMAFEGMAATSVHVALARLGYRGHGHDGSPGLRGWSAQRVIAVLPRLTAIALTIFASLLVLHILH